MDIIVDLMLVVCVACVLGVGYLLYSDSKKSKRQVTSSKKENKKSSKKSNERKDNNDKSGKEKKVTVIDSQDILEFDEIIVCNEETGLLKYDYSTFLGIVEVRGINFNLMSGDERIMLEQSFGELLNGIDFPIQFFIQSRKINLDEYTTMYKSQIEKIEQELRILEEKEVVNLDEIGLKKNQLNYGKELLDYFIQRTVKAELLERKYYIVLKYVHNAETFEHELDDYEILVSAYNDIQNKAAVIIDSLLRNNLRSQFLSAIEIGELLYSSYNRCDSTKLKFRNAVESGFNHLYTTAKPVELKKLELEIIKSTAKEEALLKEMEELQKEMGA